MRTTNIAPGSQETPTPGTKEDLPSIERPRTEIFHVIDPATGEETSISLVGGPGEDNSEQATAPK